ncbi:MAG: type IV secretion system protein [Aquisalinus sp.]|nr:type IV secretion system protein [Aquisalinus sp.]
MATYIADTLNSIDAAIAGYAQSVFTGFAGPVTTMIQAGGLVGLALVAANALFQFVPIRMSSYIMWGVRYVLVLSVATTWSQFQPIYNVLTNVPGNIGAELITATSAPDLNTALDEMVTEIFNFSDRANEESGWLGISLTAVVLIVLGALMACVAILVSALAKIGLAMSISFAPVFIACLLFSATRSLFESWTRFTIGFALIPLVLAGVMGAVIGVGQGLISGVQTASEMSQAAGFIIVIFAAIFMMFNIPSLVTGLAGTIVTTGTGIAEARAAARNTTNTVTAPVRAGYSAVARYDAGAQAADNVRENGGGRVAQTAAFVTQAARMSRDRQRFSDPSFLQPGGRSGTSNADRKAAAHSAAGASQSSGTNEQSAATTQTGLNGGRK